MTIPDDARTVVARRVLIDALDALGAHRPALVVVGAQAVYLRTGSGDLAVAAYTFDGDLALDPSLLDDDPLLEQAMTDAGFTLMRKQNAEEPGTWVTSRHLDEGELMVPVDLIVPEAFAPLRGKRSVKVGLHHKNALRWAHGLEAALVDNDVMVIASLDKADRRRVEARVAGPAALVVAKLHKLHDRATPGQRPDRLRDKDAADVYRLMQTFPPENVVATMRTLIDHPQAGLATSEAIGYLGQLFGSPRSQGTVMVISALQGVIPGARIGTVASTWAREVVAALGMPT